MKHSMGIFIFYYSQLVYSGNVYNCGGLYVKTKGRQLFWLLLYNSPKTVKKGGGNRVQTQIHESCIT